jgi:hypothetical protein
MLRKKLQSYHEKKEVLCFSSQSLWGIDHDFPSLAEGVAVPHTHYDIERNEAYVNIGTSRDPREFSCDSIRHWWYEYGITLSIGYSPHITRELSGMILTSHLFMKELIENTRTKAGLKVFFRSCLSYFMRVPNLTTNYMNRKEAR